MPQKYQGVWLPAAAREATSESGPETVHAVCNSSTHKLSPHHGQRTATAKHVIAIAALARTCHEAGATKPLEERSLAVPRFVVSERFEFSPAGSEQLISSAEPQAEASSAASRQLRSATPPLVGRRPKKHPNALPSGSTADRWRSIARLLAPTSQRTVPPFPKRDQDVRARCWFARRPHPATAAGWPRSPLRVAWRAGGLRPNVRDDARARTTRPRR